MLTNAISEDEELELLQDIHAYRWTESVSGRWKQDFGPTANFKKRKVKVGSFAGLPLYAGRLFPRLTEAVREPEMDIVRRLIEETRGLK